MGTRPANAEKRRKGASRGGKAKASREIPAIKAQLQDLTRQVLSGELPTGPAAVANQLINTRLRAVELERKVREAEDFEERLRRLEEGADRVGGGTRWGA